jgi:hypothetical protein
MGLNLSNHQIAQELDLPKDDVHQMTCQLRQGIVTKKPASILGGNVECDEVYTAAGHKGRPQAVEKRAAWSQGVMSIRRYATVKGNMPEMKMAMASMKSTSIRSKGSGRCCGRGYVRIEASRRKTCHYI